MSYNNQNNFSVTASRDGSRSFRGDHDDRWNNSSNKGFRGNPRGRGNSRGSRRGFRHFNSNSSRFRNRQNNRDVDGDVSMGGDSAGSRQNQFRNNRYQDSNRGGRYNYRRSYRGRPGPQSAGHNRDMWFQVMVPFGSSMSRDDIIGLLSSEISGFEPIKYSVDEKRAYFFVKGQSMADSLRAISRRITKPNGHKLILHVSPSQPPLEHAIDDSTKDKLKFRMSDRYDPSTQLLDLSAFYSDDVLSKENLFLPLNRASTMAAVTKIIREHIPELSGLDVSKNKILSLGHMSDLVKAAPNVVSLNLGNNQIRNIEELEKLKGWNGITELVLDGNDLCNNFSNQNSYISAVRKTFPKVIKLDGKDLPPPITFDLETIETLPPSKGSYFVNDEIKNLVVTFIKEYYSIYDSDRRRELVPAYHDNAQFSMHVSKNPLMDKQVGFHQYLENSRNLKKIGHYDTDKLAKKIKTGVLAVVSFLESLPKTTHDMNSFKVDVSLATPTMLCFVLHGLFKENECRSDKPFIRTFSRSFVTVPSGPGMVIINDMLTISNATPELSRTAFKNAGPTPSSSPVSSSQNLSVASASSATVVPAVGTVPVLTPEQLQMVENFVQQSGMNANFSLKCLEENAWDYQRAGQIFTELKSQGKIPSEAFVK